MQRAAAVRVAAELSGRDSIDVGPRRPPGAAGWVTALLLSRPAGAGARVTGAAGRALGGSGAYKQ